MESVDVNGLISVIKQNGYAPASPSGIRSDRYASSTAIGIVQPPKTILVWSGIESLLAKADVHPRRGIHIGALRWHGPVHRPNDTDNPVFEYYGENHFIQATMLAGYFSAVIGSQVALSMADTQEHREVFYSDFQPHRDP